MNTVQTITADWTVNEVVGAYPKTLPVFGRFGIDCCCGGQKTLGEVASVHRLPLDQLLADLAGVIAPPSASVVLDVRPDLQAGHDPLTKILATADGLDKNQSLVILVGFEPVPLYDVLGKRGFTHRSEQIAAGDWKVTFNHAKVET